MNICAFTMGYEDYDMLHRWCRQYSDLVGAQNVFVVSHGNDDRHREIAANCNFIGIPHTGLARFERTRNVALNGLIRFLESYYDVVIRTDVDEFVFFDPECYSELSEIFETAEADAWFAVGFNIFDAPDKPPLGRSPRFSEEQPLCQISTEYSKAVAVRNGVFLGYHGARDDLRDDASRMTMPRGLFLAHAGLIESDRLTRRYSNPDAERLTQSVDAVTREAEHARNLPLRDAEAELSEAYDFFSQGFGNWKRKRPRIKVVPRRTETACFVSPGRFIGLF